MERTDPHRKNIDPRAVVVGGLTTFAWYAVPDVVGPRWARALAKTAVAVGGAVLAVTATRDGEAARDAASSLAASLTAPDRAAGDAVPTDAAEDRIDVVVDNPAPLGAPAPAEALAVHRGVVAVVATGAAAGLLAVGVLGEKWVYRRGEALRARGVRAPHTLVGIGMGVLAAGLAAVDVPRDDAAAPGDGVSGSTTPR